MRKAFSQNILLLAVVVGSCLLVGYVLFVNDQPSESIAQSKSNLTLEDIPFDGRRAFDNLKQICDLGARISGSPGMDAQRRMLVDYFEKLGGKVELQKFSALHPRDGSNVPMANLIVQWHPERMERVLLCAHYDTRPFPDQDQFRPDGFFVGANDGASGTALLMELGRHMPALKGNVGVDFVLFDSEEFVFQEKDAKYFLGSEHFAGHYALSKPPYHYRWAILLDMIGDADLQIFQEKNTLRRPANRPLVESLWKTAARLKVREFIPRPKHDVRDDHLPLMDIAKIPSCDLIDFDYPYWHTTGDTPDKCSALSLAKVGWVLHEWLKANTVK
jgi:glutaminyl-peptide cyclotransferase